MIFDNPIFEQKAPNIPVVGFFNGFFFNEKFLF